MKQIERIFTHKNGSTMSLHKVISWSGESFTAPSISIYKGGVNSILECLSNGWLLQFHYLEFSPLT